MRLRQLGPAPARRRQSLAATCLQVAPAAVCRPDRAYIAVARSFAESVTAKDVLTGEGNDWPNGPLPVKHGPNDSPFSGATLTVPGGEPGAGSTEGEPSVHGSQSALSERNPCAKVDFR